MSTTTKAPAKKPAQKSEGFKGIKNAFVVILICVIIAFIIFYTVFGNGSHFQGGDNANVKEKVISAVSSLFGISSAKISVSKINR